MFKSGVWNDFFDVQDQRLKELASIVPKLVLSSKQDNTVKSYLSGFNRWKKWALQFPEVTILPAQPKHVAMYLASVIQNSKTHSPVLNSFYSISWAHKLACVDDPTLHDIVKKVKESSSRILGVGHNSKEPVTPQILFDLCSLYGSLNASLKDLRILSICVLAYSGFLRFDEFSNLLHSDLFFAEGYMTVFIERSKTDTSRVGKRVFISNTKSQCCPVKIVKRYIQAAGFAKDSQLYLFRALTYHKKRNIYTLRKQNKGLTYTSTREVVLNAFGSVGLDVKQFGTHSMRKGGATAAASNHVCDRLIKKHGRWQSENSKDLYISEDLAQKLAVSRNLGI